MDITPQKEKNLLLSVCRYVDFHITCESNYDVMSLYR